MRFKLSLLIFALVTVVLVVSSAFSYVSLHRDLNAGFEESKRALAGRLQMSLSQAFWNYDEAQLTTIVDAELRDLRGDALRKISQNGILALIYAHLFSLQLMREIFAIQVSQGKVPQVTELPTG